MSNWKIGMKFCVLNIWTKLPSLLWFLMWIRERWANAHARGPKQFPLFPPNGWEPIVLALQSIYHCDKTLLEPSPLLQIVKVRVVRCFWWKHIRTNHANECTSSKGMPFFFFNNASSSEVFFGIHFQGQFINYIKNSFITLYCTLYLKKFLITQLNEPFRFSRFHHETLWDFSKTKWLTKPYNHGKCFRLCHKLRRTFLTETFQRCFH